MRYQTDALKLFCDWQALFESIFDWPREASNWHHFEILLKDALFYENETYEEEGRQAAENLISSLGSGSIFSSNFSTKFAKDFLRVLDFDLLLHRPHPKKSDIISL